jgi:hypothetical protein
MTIIPVSKLTRREIDAQLDALLNQIAPRLEGQHPIIIGAALAELTGIWLAGHIDADATDNNKALRDRLVKGFLKLMFQSMRATEAVNPQDTVQ